MWDCCCNGFLSSTIMLFSQKRSSSIPSLMNCKHTSKVKTVPQNFEPHKKKSHTHTHSPVTSCINLNNVVSVGMYSLSPWTWLLRKRNSFFSSSVHFTVPFLLLEPLLHLLSQSSTSLLSFCHYTPSSSPTPSSFHPSFLAWEWELTLNEHLALLCLLREKLRLWLEWELGDVQYV